MRISGIGSGSRFITNVISHNWRGLLDNCVVRHALIGPTHPPPQDLPEQSPPPHPTRTVHCEPHPYLACTSDLEKFNHRYTDRLFRERCKRLRPLSAGECAVCIRREIRVLVTYSSGIAEGECPSNVHIAWIYSTDACVRSLCSREITRLCVEV